MSEFTEKLILPDIPNLHQLDVYERHGGYQALRKAMGMKPEEIIEEVKKSNLRGRGGACFPTGMKWSFMPKQSTKPKYLCANGDESEPGTFKDRQIFECNPHLFIEGAIIAAYAMGVTTVYTYIRGEYAKWIAILQKAVDDAYARNYIGKNILGTGFGTEFVIYRGAGAYICGEESALMNSLQGERGYPRVKPPFPAQVGLYGCPTTINNIETIANVPIILNRGAEWYWKIGAPKQPGTLLYGISGHVNKPGVYEFPTGILLTDLIYNYAGGVPGEKKIKAVIPGGSSTMWLRGEEIEGVKMDADSLKAVGTAIGTGGVIVMDEDTDVLKVLARIAHFYHHESCGQCTPCREGCGWMEKILNRFLAGDGTMSDIDLLMDVANNIEGNTICALGDAAAWPVQSVIRKFREEFEARAKKSPTAPKPVTPPHLVTTFDA
ncbi:MAG: NADH-quinone oxidoreductase subunit NuoF [Ignavibacteriae bacterium]|nr:NADH-quinone oxidoreductase subunit NuoF [Ignavibacteria bacterium]MBI3364916.1 NADH-quinone oxidoreductase subunit NuoF [Ignavibacteriota bacterium]